MSLRPCLTCGALTRTGSYCSKHRPPESPGKQRSGGKQASFRERTFARYGNRCMACHTTGSPDNPIEAAHDVRMDELDEQGGYHEYKFGVPLCRRCHRKIDAAMRRERGRMG
jgi:hypothetical protein